MIFRIAGREIRERWWVVILAIIVGGGAVVALDGHLRSKPDYMATHTLVLAAQSSGGTARPNQVTLSIAQSLLQNPEVIAAAGKNLNYHGDISSLVAHEVTSNTSSSSEQLNIVVTAKRSQDAVALADALADAVVSQLQTGDTANYQAELHRDETQVAQLTNQVSALTQQLQAAGGNTPSASSNPTVATLKSQLQETTQELTAATQRANALANQGIPGPEFNTYAPTVALATSTLPVPSSKVARLILGQLFGGLVAIVALICVAYLDTRIRSRAAAQLAFGAPVIAEIPRLRFAGRSGIVSARSPRSPATAAFQRLETDLLEVGPSDGAGAHRAKHKIIVIASGRRQEGRTTVLVNLAACAAAIGRSTLAVDMNLRAPAVAYRLGAANAKGLSDLIEAGGVTIDDSMQQTKVPRVTVIGAGSKSDNPMSVVPVMGQLADQLTKQDATVLMEAPPLLTSAESSAVLDASDRVLLICRWGRTKRVDAWRVAEQLERLGVEVAGVVIVDSVTGGAPARSSSLSLSTESTLRTQSFNQRQSPIQTNGGSGRWVAYQGPPTDTTKR